ncbi:EAL domain-containing protein [Chitinasiproducens palmae]|uniref:EAL domain, c-di-GMP-specific phosphodiesterase class I (Or its enzymatically inactive variant) n=1 Tax=Chitinasiproducens palmae TaxID=1770053 RepID=A0A1H2PNM7_9BURK|nr:EAL domain-containing protein [Chitinasiproducens palmae]SDV48282.1 EAL domain, c-di-GMP-specific phosphodiesterase class I (or its enzymatically inactive variant) [Chitinasiproducens palmae]
MIPVHLAGARRSNAGCEGCLQESGRDIPFTFAYQPIVDLAGRRVFAHEALVRGPAGQSAYSVLSQIDGESMYGFDQRCREKAIAGAARLGMTERLSINFLPNAVYRAEVCIQRTLEAAARHRFPIDRIIFETVESERVDDEAHLASIFREYQRLGLKTAIDDFGAGASGLRLLADFQPDIVKLDMALIRGIDHDRARRAIVGGVVAMCNDLGIEVIAEGVETADERNCLADNGISLMQGYLFARPAFEALAPITEGSWLPAA